MSFKIEINPFRSSDTYKGEHDALMPPDFIRGEAYVEPRTGRALKRVRFFGLGLYAKRYLSCAWTPEDFDRAQVLYTKAGTPLPDNLRLMALEYGRFGKLPIEIYALPEGVVVPAGTPLLKVRAIEGEYGEFANWMESQLRIWGTTTVCTNSYEIREELRHYYELSGAPMEALPFALHDFGMRGTLCEQESGLAGAAHLLNFRGSDNAEAMGVLEDYYGVTDWAKTVFADEHNVTIAWGKHRRKEYIEFLCHTRGTVPGTKFSHVMDTYDQDEEFDLICGEMKPLIDATFGTTPGCMFITRPDTGAPNVNVTKYGEQLINAYGDPSLSEFRRTLPYIGAIQGDSIDRAMARSCAYSLHLHGIRADQWAYGSGGGLLRKHTRDDAGFAQKMNRALFEDAYGEQHWQPTRKVPKSDMSKASKGGDLSVWIDKDGNWQNGTVNERPFGCEEQLKLFYSPGKIHQNPSFAEIASRA